MRMTAACGTLTIEVRVRTAIVKGAIFFLLTAFLTSLLLSEAVKSQHSSGANNPQAKPSSPTFYKDVLPILQNHCQSCHRPGEIAPLPLVTYEQTQSVARKIGATVAMKMMPPWFADPRYGHFANDPSLTEEEIKTLVTWAENAAPAGDPRDAPPAKKWAAGWNIAEPNAIVTMPRPVALPANGEIEYTYEIVPTHFAQDRWVQMAELRPSSPAHVHHAVVYIRPPDSTWLKHAPLGVPFTASTLIDPDERRQAHETTSDLLLVYAPGSSPDQWSDGMAKFVPAGSDLVFQMHYTTNGKADEDRTSIGLVFAKSPPSRLLKNSFSLVVASTYGITSNEQSQYIVVAEGTQGVFQQPARGSPFCLAIRRRFIDPAHCKQRAAEKRDQTPHFAIRHQRCGFHFPGYTLPSAVLWNHPDCSS
jgi:hypothetical protein